MISRSNIGGLADDLPNDKVDELDSDGEVGMVGGGLWLPIERDLSQEVPELLRLTVGRPLIDQPESLGFFDLRCGDINSSGSLVNRGDENCDRLDMVPAVKALMVVMRLSAVSGRGGEVSI
jgi:hypothetical protein